MKDQERASMLVGLVYIGVGVVLWSSWTVITRFGVTAAGLDALDLALLRFCVAGLVMLPLVVRRWPQVRAQPPWRIAALMIGAGAPYAFVAAAGFGEAPASHGGLIPVTIPVFAALLLLVLTGTKPSFERLLGLSAIVVGAALFLTSGPTASSQSAWRGDLLFMLAALLWACYTMVLKKSGLDVWLAAASVSVASMAFVLPIYLGLRGWHLPPAPLGSLAAQGVFHGVMISVVALICFNQSIARLGPVRTSSCVALVPGMAAMLAIPALGEWPSAFDWLRIAVVSAGALFASGLMDGRLSHSAAAEG